MKRIPGPAVGKVCALVAVLVVGCVKLPDLQQAGSDVVQGAVGELSAQRDTLAGVLTPAARALVNEVAAAFADSLRGVLDSTVAAVFTTAGSGVGAIQADLATFVSGDLNRSVTDLLDTNVRTLDASVARALENWLATAGASARSNLIVVIGEAVDTAGTRAVASLGAGLSAPAFRRSVTDLADSVVTQALAAIDRATQRETPWWVWALFIGFAVIVLSLLGGFIVNLKRALRQREESLRAVTMAIKERGDVDLKERVKHNAQVQGVESWLNSYLKENNLLVK